MSKIHKVNNNIYITSDGEIKEGDWCLDSSETIVVKCLRTGSDSYWNKNCKKIILTTDQDLINDGIQVIDDEFLEWFVNNPSCESVEIEEFAVKVDLLEYKTKYKIIIPKEEPTMIDDWLDEHGDPEIYKKVEKQLELEEAAINFYREFPSNPLDKPEWHYNRDVDCFKKRKAFINGAKYMAEKMYSEKDMSESFFQGWTTRERFDDLVPDIIYPEGLDYEEKQEYAFNLWFEKLKKISYE